MANIHIKGIQKPLVVPDSTAEKVKDMMLSGKAGDTMIDLGVWFGRLENIKDIVFANKEAKADIPDWVREHFEIVKSKEKQSTGKTLDKNI